MGIRERLGLSRPAEQYAVAAQTIAGPQYNRPTWPSWDPEMAAKAGYARLALIYRCVNIIAHALGTAPVRVYDEANDNETITDHSMRKLMRRPNPQMGEAAFWSHVGTRAAIAGFCVCEKERNNAGDVIALWPLQSTWLKAVARRDSAHDWEYRIPGIAEVFLMDAEDVVAFRWADTPSGSPYGMGPLEACLREIAISNAMTDFLKAFFEGGAVPLQGLILDTSPGVTLNQGQIEDVLDNFTRRRGGLHNAWRPTALTGVKDIKRLGFDFNELAYADLRDLSELAIIQAFGIPASIAQIRVGLEHSDSRANAEVDEGKFYRQTIIPLWGRFDDALTLNLLPDFDEQPNISLEFDFSKISALQEDRNAKAAWVNSAVNAGWMTAHTAHRELGLTPPETPDFYIRYLALQAIPADTPIPDFIAEPVETPTLPADTPTLGAMRPPLALSASRGRGPQHRMAAAGRDRALIARIATKRQASITTFFRDQGKRIVPKLTNALAGRGPDEVYDAAQIDWDKEDERLETELSKLYHLAGKTAFDAIEANYGIDIGIKFDLANPRVKDTVDILVNRAGGVKDINDSTRQDIARIVTQGMDAGKTNVEIADQLKGLFDETYQNRAMTIARTESMVSYGHASALGFRESGVVDRIQCFDNEGHADDYGAEDGLSCAQRNGLVDTLDSTELHISSEHPNGSLVVTPVMIGEDV